jgi:copper chaperone CopZ
MKGERVVTFAAVLTALAASLCCVGPLLFVAFGAGAAAAVTAFAPARPYLLALAALALAFGFYRAYFRREACGPGETCGPKPASRRTRLSLWLASFAVILFALSPYYAGALSRRFGGDKVTSPPAAGGLTTARQTFKVNGMTCAGCETTIRLALEETSGVRAAQVSYERGEAVVEYDPTVTTKEKLRRAIDQTGYTCELPR